MNKRAGKSYDFLLSLVPAKTVPSSSNRSLANMLLLLHVRADQLNQAILPLIIILTIINLTHGFRQGDTII